MKASSKNPQREAIAKAKKALEAGLLVIIPTDTVYGLAAHPAVAGAIEKIYEAKQRERSKPVPMLVSGMEIAVARGAQFGRAAKALAARFWPGPLTLVVPVAGGFEGFRVPAHPVAQALLEAVGGALYATSANVSGQRPASSAEEAARLLAPFVAAVIDGSPRPLGIASTVVKIKDEIVAVLREGAVPRADIESCAHFM